jgi:O-antigen/teichoic acid export membrane protein
MGTTVVSSLLGYVYWMLAARQYAPADVGLAASLVAALTIASAASSIGLGATAVQTLPGRRRPREWSTALNSMMLVAALLGIPVALAIVAGLPLASSSFDVLADHPAVALLLVIGVVIANAASVLDSAFIAERASGYSLFRNLVFAVVKLPLVVLPVVVGLGASGILATWVAGIVAGLLLGFWLILRMKPGYSASVRSFRGEAHSALRSLAGQHPISVANISPVYLLPIFVSVELSNRDNAFFSTTWRVGIFFFMVSAAVAVALFAEGSNASGRLRSAARTAVVAVALLLIPAIAVAIVFGRDLLGMFGPEYAEHGYALLVVLAISAIPDAVTNVYVTVLRVQGRLAAAARLSVSMAVVCLVLGWLLLPQLGIVGGGVAWLVAQSVGSAIVAFDLLHRRRSRVAFEGAR